MEQSKYQISNKTHTLGENYKTEACFVYFTEGKSLHFTWQSPDRYLSYEQVVQNTFP